MRRIRTFVLGLVLFPAPAMVAAAQCGAPPALHDGWKTAAPAQEGLDPKLICAIGPTLEKMAAADPNGVVIVRHGALVYEHYFTGEDRHWLGGRRWATPLSRVSYNANTLHDLQSVTKSVVALLVGIAFDRGWLKSLNAPVLSFFPKYADLRTPGKNRITLRELLSMTSGLFWPGGIRSFQRMNAASDPYRFVLAKPIVAAPGTIWNYSNGGAEVIGAIVTKVSGRPLDQFAREALFDPLGISDWEWVRLADGNPSAAGGLRLRPRDLAKIGQLVLNRGIWHGHRIISAAWIRQMTVPHSPPGWLSGIADSYGYLWWLGHHSLDNRDITWIGGLGYGGQRLYVVPSRDLVVAVTAGDYRPGGAQDIVGYTALGMALHAALPR